jgi:hypothetical protein
LDKKEDIFEFEKLEQQLYSFHAEISELSRKKPNDALNKFKLQLINATLTGLNALLGDHRPFDDFEKFDVDDLPTNSDVVVILGQYAGAAYNFRREHTQLVSFDDWRWVIRGKASDLETKSPDSAKPK